MFVKNKQEISHLKEYFFQSISLLFANYESPEKSLYSLISISTKSIY